MTYLPVKGEPFTVSMGLRSMDLDKWIEIDEHFDQELSEKQQLLANKHDQVFASLPEGLSGSTETLEISGSILFPRTLITFPSTFTLPSRINFSQARLLATPESAKNFCNRICGTEEVYPPPSI